jgi:hypothetical protein
MECGNELARRRYDRDPVMLRHFFLCLLAFALFNASPGLHWHEHAHETVSAASPHHEGHEEEEHEGAQELCLDCVFQAQQAAPSSAGGPWRGATPPAAGVLHGLHARALPQDPPGGAIRVRGPPSIGS